MGRLFDKYGPKWLVIPGLVILTVIIWFFTTISPTSSVAFIIALHIGLTVGIALIWTPAQTNGLNQLPPELYPHGTAVMNTLQQVGGPDWNSSCNQYPYGRYGEIFARLLRPDQSD
ncbi:hypothetical protein MUB24_22565 [Lederbergia sp. NSJ-179]|uniref:MFS transporter n=1 Tax=Lederbergia sp. NSJ-179 TaxID=2931402 RepID=UPI001FD069D1|nr:MFS transporter [Lederbergia sp. NSJ-179]MCJ7843603.1 hypothetical protein [Lederbergia sp. NSJ-179]